jgi:hypothetical protein
MINNVITPLKSKFGSQFGGVMGWEFALDQGGTWANGIGQALNANQLDATFTVYHQAVIRSSYVGTGIHFAPFEKPLTTDQWNTVLTRIGFLAPSFARVMIGADFYSTGLDGSGNPVYTWNSGAMQQTYRMLDYCQANAIAVVFGEWGPPDSRSPSLFPNIGVTSTVWTKMIGDCLDYLRNTKGYTCIRYYNFVNEPNGSWSGVGNYPDWKTGLNNLYKEISGRGFLSWLEITGPDTTGADDWVGTAAGDGDLSSRLGTYDIHRYDTASDVESGALAEQMTALRYTINTIDASGQSKTFTMNETGILDGKIAPDSQPNVKIHKYGVWTADMVVQDILGGMDGQINWDLDDAQHTGGGYGSDNLKEWGFWNSYGGQDGYDPADADPRPWFYTWSLLAKFLAYGGQTVSVANDKSVSGVRVAALKKANLGAWDFTFVVVNDSDTPRAINIVVPGASACTMQQYNYQSGDAPNYPVDGNKLPRPVGTYTFNLGSGFIVTPQARSVYVFTTFGAGTPAAVPPPSVPTGRTIWLKAGVNGNYVSAWLGGVNPLQARSMAVQTWEKFNVIDTGSGFVALQAQANNLYVSAWISDPNTPLEARAQSVNTWEKFQWCDLGNGSVALKAAADGLFVSVWSDVNTPLQARSTNANGWEIFQWGTTS